MTIKPSVGNTINVVLACVFLFLALWTHSVADKTDSIIGHLDAIFYLVASVLMLLWAMVRSEK